MTRKEELELLIKRNDYLYWVMGDPEIPDADYDELVEELRILEQDNPLVNRINTPVVTSDDKITHQVPMLSLDKKYSVEEILEWCGKVARNENELFDIQLKLDGATGEFNSGVLSTRGDGYIGEDISDKLPIVKFEGIENPDYLIGEIVMTLKDFDRIRDKICRKSGKSYKTPRNACAGLINRSDVNESLGKILTFVPFNHVNLSVKYKHMIKLDWNTLIQKAIMNKYPTDGLVIKLHDEEYSKSLGATSHHPKGQMALKFKNPTGRTKLIDIFWSSGKNVITPVGKVEPVEISGVIVSNVNLHNYKYVLDNDIHIGDEIIVERCGDIIPDVQEVIPGENRVEIKLDTCPACGGKVIYDKPVLRCSNDECTGKLLQCLSDSVVRIGIERLGEPTLKKLIDSKDCNSLIDIFNLTKEDILELDGFANSSAQNLYDEIHKVIDNGVYEWQILASLNIESIGVRMSESVLKTRSLLDLRKMSTDELMEIEGIGIERSGEIFLSLNILGNYIDALKSILKIRKNKETNMDERTICFTGTFPEKKAHYHKLAEVWGWTPSKSVTKTLSLLVKPDPDFTSGKVDKAIKYNVPVVTLDAFMETIG